MRPAAEPLPRREAGTKPVCLGQNSAERRRYTPVVGRHQSTSHDHREAERLGTPSPRRDRDANPSQRRDRDAAPSSRRDRHYSIPEERQKLIHPREETASRRDATAMVVSDDGPRSPYISLSVCMYRCTWCSTKGICTNTAYKTLGTTNNE